jgi:segregation and condensation protein A
LNLPVETTTTPQPTTAGQEDNWDDPVRSAAATDSEALIVDVAGFEGPLDLLLAMARTQKVDLSGVSVLALAEQYLDFIAEAQRLRLELAADYLVMAAWLTYLKSRLLLPREESNEDEPSGEELAQRLAFRLARLEAMRDVAARLMTRERLGRDVFARGRPETVKTTRETHYNAELFDLLRAYADQRKRTLPRVHVVKRRTVWSIKDARQRLERLVGKVTGSWLQLDACLRQYLGPREEHRTVVASSLGAMLEMAREGLVELRQDDAYGPIYVRRREPGALWEKVGE